MHEILREPVEPMTHGFIYVGGLLIDFLFSGSKAYTH